MTAPRLQEVVARVVAWHNRHPLARRIDASQVHSIGEVRLPFASKQPVAGAPVPAAATAATAPAVTPDDALPPSMSSLGAALAQRNARLHPPASDTPAPDAPEPPPADAAFANLAGADAGPDLDPPHGDAPPAPAADAALATPPTAADDSGDDEAALVIPLLDGDTDDTATVVDARTAADAPTDDPADQAADSAPDALAQEAADANADAVHVPAADAPTHTTTDTAADAIDAAWAAPQGDPSHDPDAVYPPPHGAVPASALARAVERRAAARAPHGADADHATAAEQGTGTPDVAPSAPQATPAPALPAAQPTSRWQRLRAAVRRLLTGRQPGLPPMRAAFSQDFAWPLKPARIARWAQRHGQLQPLAPPDWPHRTIDTDRARAAMLRQAGHAHDLPLHVLTAAIGVGDRRIRVLVGADGSVLGPRAWDRGRAGSLGVLAAAGLVALGWHLRPVHGPDPGADAAVLAALAASAAVPASAADAAAAPASGASASDDTHAAEADHTASAPGDAASTADHATALASAASAPDDAASGPQADIRPALSPEEKYAARVESARLRGEPPPPPPTLAEAGGPVYALVGPSSAQREHAAGSLALMKAAATKMDGAAPAHGELVQSQGQWRAAWWPFPSLVDAERARVLLAGRGLKAEVVEF